MRVAAVFALLALGAAAPPSAERKAVLDALLPAVEAKLGPDVEFVVQVLRVENGWAFIMADPQRRGGNPIDGYRIFGENFGNMDGLRVDAVLHRQGGRWRVVDHAIGATDVWYCDIGPKSLKRGYGC
jgi:hypothetical protein